MDKIVFDIETKNSFEDVGGRENLRDLEVSVIGAYSYAEDKYLFFQENEFDKFGQLAKNSKLFITFSGKRFDIPVLEKYFNFNLTRVPNYDILEEIEKSLGRRISLAVLSEANLGVGQGKIGSGMDAIDFYKRGQMEKLREYCLQDVKVTKQIFDLICEKGHLWIPERGIPQMKKLSLYYKEEDIPQAKLL